MRIKNIELQNFKGVENFFASFKDTNEITGKNGAGKSSIKESIIFGLYGRTPDGSAQNVDTFIKKGEGSTKVTVTLPTDEKIKRMKSERSTMLYFEDNSQEEENSRVAQRDLEGSAIPNFDHFINVFNTGFFMNELDDKAQRSFVMNLTPPIDRLELFRTANGNEKLCREFGIDPEDFIGAFKKAKAERLEWKNELDKLRNQLEYIREQIPADKLAVDVSLLEKEFETLANYAMGLRDALNKWKEYRTREQERNPAVMHNAKVTRQAEEILKQIEDVPEEPTREYIDKLNAEIINLYSVVIPTDNECPTCKQGISKEHRMKIDEFNRSSAEKRKLLEIEYNEKRVEYENTVENRMKIIRKNRDCETQAKTLRDSVVDLPDLVKPAVNEPTEEEVIAQEAKAAELNVIINNKKEELSYKEKIDSSKKTLEEIELLCNLFGPTGLPSIEAEKKVKPVETELAKFIPGATIITLRLLKNGMEYKDTFDIEVNGKRYARLSSGEKKKVDFALAIIFNKFLKIQLGDNISIIPESVFIDDADLIDQKGLEEIMSNVDDLQVFTTHVTNNNLILKTYDRRNDASDSGK